MSTNLKIEPYIRWMITRDLPRVMEIEEDVFKYPWTEKNIKTLLKERKSIGMSVVLDNRVIGYIIYELKNTSFEIIKLAIDREFWRQGIGAQVIDKMKSKLNVKDSKRKSITILLRESNLLAQLFLKSQNFKYIKTIKKYYTIEDAYLFEYKK